MKLGITGSRTGLSDSALKYLTKFIEDNLDIITEAHHGDCIGVDKIFHDICTDKNIKIIIHPPDNNLNRAYCKSDFIEPEKKYLIRNHDIVNACDFILAFPAGNQEILRSGTWATIRYAEKTGKKYNIVYPNGTIKN